MTVQFDPASYSVTEGGQAELVLVLSGPADRDVTVQFTTVDDSAVGKVTDIHNDKKTFTISFPAGPNGDYTTVTQTVTFPAGQTSQTVPVNTLDDQLSEELESFGASLSSPIGNGLSFSVGSQDMATVDIVDNDGI